MVTKGLVGWAAGVWRGLILAPFSTVLRFTEEMGPWAQNTQDWMRILSQTDGQTEGQTNIKKGETGKHSRGQTSTIIKKRMLVR